MLDNPGDKSRVNCRSYLSPWFWTQHEQDRKGGSRAEEAGHWVPGEPEAWACERGRLKSQAVLTPGFNDSWETEDVDTQMFSVSWNVDISPNEDQSS